VGDGPVADAGATRRGGENDRRKADGDGEGLNAAAFAAFTEWLKIVAGQSLSAETMSARIVAAAVKPGRRRVKANAKRLGRRKRI
jgi:hypothetical protein